MILFAQFGLAILLLSFSILHMLILSGIIDYNRVWGGRLKNRKEMYRFEAISLFGTVFFLFLVLSNLKWVPIYWSSLTQSILLWVMTGFFALNTLGNFVSKNKIEKMIFGPLTILMTFFALILAWSN